MDSRLLLEGVRRSGDPVLEYSDLYQKRRTLLSIMFLSKAFLAMLLIPGWFFDLSSTRALKIAALTCTPLPVRARLGQVTPTIFLRFQASAT